MDMWLIGANVPFDGNHDIVHHIATKLVGILIENDTPVKSGDHSATYVPDPSIAPCEEIILSHNGGVPFEFPVDGGDPKGYITATIAITLVHYQLGFDKHTLARIKKALGAIEIGEKFLM